MLKKSENKSSYEPAYKHTQELFDNLDPDLSDRLFQRIEECGSVYPIPYCAYTTHYPNTNYIDSCQIIAVSHGVAVDLGANIGAFSFIAARHFDKIYAFEPVKKNYDDMHLLLDKSLENFGDIIKTYNLAVGEKDKENIKIYINEKQKSDCSLYKSLSTELDENNYEIVNQISLETLYKTIEQEYIDYLKLDVEGAEYEFLYDQDMSRIKYIALEIGAAPSEVDITFRDLSNFLVDNFFPLSITPNHFFGVNRRCIKNLKYNDPVNLYTIKNLAAVDGAKTELMTQQFSNDIISSLYNKELREYVYKTLALK